MNLAIDHVSVDLPPTGISGDYNGNGVVDAADYTVWRDNLGKSVTLPNDTTPGTVVQADFDVWKNNFGLHRRQRRVQLREPFPSRPRGCSDSWEPACWASFAAELRAWGAWN